MKLFLCSHFSSVGSLIKEEIENKKVVILDDDFRFDITTPYSGSELDEIGRAHV